MHRATNIPARQTAFTRVRDVVWIGVCFGMALRVSGAPLPAYSQAVADEYQVKAAFLFNFAQFVDWPESALGVKENSIIVCIFDDEPRRQELQSTIEGKALGTRVFHVHLLSHQRDIQGCNILFLSRDEASHQTVILTHLSALPVLTVGETDNFLVQGGMIRFRIDQNKTRFEINLGAADAAHLKISSRLLLLATSVMRGNGTDRAR